MWHKRSRTQSSLAWFAILAIAAGWTEASGQIIELAPARHELEPVHHRPLEYRLLVRATFLPTAGMRIDWVAPDGPAARLTMPNHFGIITLEPGDVITHVNGRFVSTAVDYQAAMNGSVGNFPRAICRVTC